MNRTIRREDLDELRHYGVKGMKWAEKNQKALPSSDFQEKARKLLKENVNTEPKKMTKLEESNARDKLVKGEVSPDLFGLSPLEIKQYYMLSPEERKNFDATMVEKAKIGAIINGREVLERIIREKTKNDPEKMAKEKEKNASSLSGKVQAKVDSFLKSIFTETTTYHYADDAKKKQGPPKPKKKSPFSTEIVSTSHVVGSKKK